MTNGIYLYYDTKKNSVVYVGRDSNIDKNKRHKDHMAKSRYSKQPFNSILQNNPDRYEYRVYCEGDFSNEELNNLEIQTIKLFDTFHREDAFNYTEGGDGIVGCKRSKETRKKMSEARKGKYCGENHPFYGKKHKKESRKKISEARKGKYCGENHPFYGKKHKKESRKKISEAKSGKNHPQWKNYARVVKKGFASNRKQRYALIHNGKIIKRSIYKEKLEKLAEEINKKEK